MDRMYRRQRHIYDLTRKFYLLGRDHLIDALQPPPGGACSRSPAAPGATSSARRALSGGALLRPRRFGGDADNGARAFAAAGLSGRIMVARGDAADSPRALFGVAAFDRVVISYALSMIPPGARGPQRASSVARRRLARRRFRRPGRPAALVSAALRGWLARFRDAAARSGGRVAEVGATREMSLDFRPLFAATPISPCLRERNYRLLVEITPCRFRAIFRPSRTKEARTCVQDPFLFVSSPHAPAFAFAFYAPDLFLRLQPAFRGGLAPRADVATGSAQLTRSPGRGPINEQSIPADAGGQSLSSTSTLLSSVSPRICWSTPAQRWW